MCTGRMATFKRISAYCKTNDNDDDDRHQLATRERKKRSNKKNNNPPSSHLSLRHTISAVAFCGMYFYKRERKRGRENHAVRSHFDSHPHYDKSAVIKLRVSFSVFCFPTLSRVPHLERAGNKKEKKEDELHGSWNPVEKLFDAREAPHPSSSSKRRPTTKGRIWTYTVSLFTFIESESCFFL